MTIKEPRFDVVCDLRGISIEQHFCREWDEDGGCYGTRPDHGISFEEAKNEMVEYHERSAKEWKEMTLDKWYEMNGMNGFDEPD